MRVNHVEALDIQTHHVAHMVCAFLWTAAPLNVIASFRKARINVAVDENLFCCIVIPCLARCLLNPAGLRPVLILGETEGEAGETCAYISISRDESVF
jgi:hypothetical protein